MVLLWVLSYSAFSRADDVTVPLVNGIYVTVTTNTSTPLQEIKNNPAAVQVQLGDDNSIVVPLQFTYNYFGQTYTQTWMHSNGSVSFQSPQITGNFCCSGQDLSMTQNDQFDYSIMALWTDLYARNGGSTYYLSTPTSMTYGWYGTSDYGNSDLRSSFEIMIDNTGGLDVIWAEVNSNQLITMGFTGNLNEGEYYQYYHGGGNSLAALQVRLGDFGVPPEVDPCTAIPVTDPTCPETYQPETPTETYEETIDVANPEMINQTSDSVMITSDSNLNSLSGQQQQSTPMESNNSSLQLNSNSQAGPGPQASSPGPSQQTNQQQSNSPAPQQQASSKSTSSSISTSQIMSMNSNEQSKLSNVEKATVQASAEASSKIDADVAKEAEKVVDILSESSSSTNVSSTSSQTNNVLNKSTQTINSDAMRPATTSNEAFTSDNVSLFSSAPNASMLLLPAGMDAMKKDRESMHTEAELPKLIETNFTDKTSPITEILEKKPDIEFTNKEQTKDTQKKEIQNNELAEGVDIATMAIQPKGYESYSTSLLDSPFYAPKEIYRNQKPIDNAKASRAFELRNDIVHQQMIEHQYLQ